MTTPGRDELREQIAAALTDHQLSAWTHKRWRCTCGVEGDSPAPLTSWVQHQTDAVLPGPATVEVDVSGHNGPELSGGSSDGRAPVSGDERSRTPQQASRRSRGPGFESRSPLSSRAGWWCPDCDRFLVKPPHLNAGLRFHAWRCPSPMVAAIRQIDARR